MLFPLLMSFIILYQVAASMNDLCFDIVGISKEKKDPKSVKNNRGRTTQEGPFVSHLEENNTLETDKALPKLCTICS